MGSLPIVAHHQADPGAAMRQKVERLANDLLRDHGEFRNSVEFRRLIPTSLSDGPTLHIDDLSEITEQSIPSALLCQERARLRAGDGDVVITNTPVIDGYDRYLKDCLGLGSPVWLRPASAQNPLHIAEATWEDRSVRRELVRRMRQNRLTWLHPHMGSFPVWELASLLQQTSHRPLRVVAPPPPITRWANNKVAFTTVVTELFGSRFVPRSGFAWNLATAARRIQEIAQCSPRLCVKVPDSAGGGGNVVLASEQFTNRTLMETRMILRDALATLDWAGEQPLLISAWETDVQCSPSVQLWIPPVSDGVPLVEGIFVQSIVGTQGNFNGNHPARFPHAVTEEIVDRCWLLGRLFQLLGYVGRCSFDLILAGTSPATQRMEFIECNGRWGGTSLPMTLMNRIFGDWAKQPHAVNICCVPGLHQLSFSELLTGLGSDLYDKRTGDGRFILFNPGRMAIRSAIAVIGLADDWDAAVRIADHDFRDQARKILAAHAAESVGS